jgi:hypothetical protein
MYIMVFLNRFTGDVAELGIIRAGSFMKVKVVLNPRVNLVMPLESWLYIIYELIYQIHISKKLDSYLLASRFHIMLMEVSLRI